jgi:hypothetical protein
MFSGAPERTHGLLSQTYLLQVRDMTLFSLNNHGKLALVCCQISSANAGVRLSNDLED